MMLALQPNTSEVPQTVRLKSHTFKLPPGLPTPDVSFHLYLVVANSIHWSEISEFVGCRKCTNKRHYSNLIRCYEKGGAK